jgi:crotonobetainyl-CoA:carnitine CoA-transferase CaiB-like acyl-CoA transferase
MFPVHSFESLLEDEHLRDIGYFRDVQHPSLGTLVETAVPSEWHGTPPTAYRLPPMPGEHSGEVLAEAGYAPLEIEALFEAGASARPEAVSLT